MTKNLHGIFPAAFPDARRSFKQVPPVLLASLILVSSTSLNAQPVAPGFSPARAPASRGATNWSSAGDDDIQDVSGKYHFLSAEDTVGLLEEEGKLKGYVDVYQGEEESDAILSYPITIGLREKNHVEFKTGKIHQKYYRFSGTVQRGEGRRDTDPDYLRLVGDLEIVTVKADTRKEVIDRRHEVFKSKGKAECDQE